MVCSAKVICDSISDAGIRLTTMQLRYPRLIHSEVLTHRVFSRNGRSSRAVPFSVLVKEIPYVPHFMKNKPGMVASEEMEWEDRMVAERLWLNAAEYCQNVAQQLADLGVHKQWVNRMLEWFGYIDVLVTSTDWDNFFALRQDGGAQPEIIELANAMKDALDGSTPARAPLTSWHLPYIDYAIDTMAASKFLNQFIDLDSMSLEYSGNQIMGVLKRISVARCARLTIKPFDGDGSIEKELDRYDKLMVSRPVHASPAEHIATPDTLTSIYKHEWGNFYGWRQFRKMIPHNTVYDR
jgi:hypothetical protein